MGDATIAVSVAIFVVWMQRKKRWSLFFGALSGKYGIIAPSSSGGSSSGSSPSSSSSSGSSNPSTQTEPNSSNPIVGG